MFSRDCHQPFADAAGISQIEKHIHSISFFNDFNNVGLVPHIVGARGHNNV